MENATAGKVVLKMSGLLTRAMTEMVDREKVTNRVIELLEESGEVLELNEEDRKNISLFVEGTLDGFMSPNFVADLDEMDDKMHVSDAFDAFIQETSHDTVDE